MYIEVLIFSMKNLKVRKCDIIEFKYMNCVDTVRQYKRIIIINILIENRERTYVRVTILVAHDFSNSDHIITLPSKSLSFSWLYMHTILIR